jgi:integrase/recombinase XerD
VLLHKCSDESLAVYTLFDSEERVVVHPTYYLNYLRKHRRPESSQRQIANIIKLYCQWLENSPFFQDICVDDALASVDYEDILKWVNHQRDEGIAEKTIHNREILIREMYRWFTTEVGGRLREDIPWDIGPITKEPHKRLPRFITVEQVITLLKGFHNESQRVAAHFIFDTGVRISELIRMTNRLLPNERDWPDEVNYYPLEIQGSKARDGSKYKKRDTIISRPMLARLKRYHSTLTYRFAKNWSIFDPDKPTFLNVHGEKLTSDSVYRGIKAAWIRQQRDPYSE